ncbi:MAG: hypothetical protein LBL83_06015, partial [Clostridiales bacterium]|nr:hypothetical protein [Clostridiales bacterium]
AQTGFAVLYEDFAGLSRPKAGLSLAAQSLCAGRAVLLRPRQDAHDGRRFKRRYKATPREYAMWARLGK